MPQSPLISFEYVVQNELERHQQQQNQLPMHPPDFLNGVPVMTHPTVNGNVKPLGNNPSNNPGRPGYQVFRPQENLEVWLHGPR